MKRAQTPLLALVLFLSNFYLCRELFHIEYLRHMGSIEGAYIGISRYALAHWGDLLWFSQWYDGVPYQNTYPPLLHFAVTGLARLTGYTPAHAHHWVTAFLYCLGPVTLFALALRISGSKWAAFAAGLIYSFVSASAWLVPEIARDLGSRFYPRRLQALVFWGEGPHVSAMTLLPLALFFVDIAMKRRRAPWFALAAVFVTLPVLTNWLAAFALMLMVFAYLLARLGPKGWNWRDVAYLTAIGIVAYCLAMPLAPPSTVAVTQHNARTIGGDFRLVYQALPRWAAVILIALVWAKIAVRKMAPHLQFAIFLSFLTCLLTLAAGWFNISIMPQPLRYHLEMEMALAMLAAFTAHALLRNRPRWMAIAAFLALAVVLVVPVRKARRYARDFLIQPVDITKTTEWKTAAWLNHHWSGERVMMSGSNSFWLTAFSDIPELGGGFEQGTTDESLRVAEYEIYTSDHAGAHDAEYSLLWLKAFGVQAVNVTGPHSGEFYHPYANPKKFEGVLEPLWRDGDDAIYRVGRPHASLACVVRSTDLVSRTPINGIDVDPLRPYVAALDNLDSPRAPVTWTSLHSLHIETDLAPGQVVSIQMAWHGGWYATAHGRRLPVNKDAIGLMYVDPGPGHASIDLLYDGGLEMAVALWLRVAAILLLAAASTHAILKKTW